MKIIEAQASNFRQSQRKITLQGTNSIACVPITSSFMALAKFETVEQSQLGFDTTAQTVKAAALACSGHNAMWP